MVQFNRQVTPGTEADLQSFQLTIRDHNGKDVNEATPELTSIFKRVSSEIKAS